MKRYWNGKVPEHVPPLYRLERSDDGRLDVAENGIGPAETRELFRPAELSRNHRLVNAPNARHRTEAAQSIGDDTCRRCEVGAGHRFDIFAVVRLDDME